MGMLEDLEDAGKRMMAELEEKGPDYLNVLIEMGEQIKHRTELTLKIHAICERNPELIKSFADLHDVSNYSDEQLDALKEEHKLQSDWLDLARRMRQQLDLESTDEKEK